MSINYGDFLDSGQMRIWMTRVSFGHGYDHEHCQTSDLLLAMI